MNKTPTNNELRELFASIGAELSDEECDNIRQYGCTNPEVKE